MQLARTRRFARTRPADGTGSRREPRGSQPTVEGALADVRALHRELSVQRSAPQSSPG